MDKDLAPGAATEPPGRTRLSPVAAGASLSPDVPAPTSRFIPDAGAFRRRHFPGVSAALWQDWRWQLGNRVTTLDALERVLRLTPDERHALTWPDGALPFAVTPHYLHLLDPDDPSHPLRRCVVPSCLEHAHTPGEAADPLGEEHHSPVPGIVHRYADRVLFLATRFCSTYCRYCTRSRLVGDAACGAGEERRRWEAMLAYVEATPAVRDVLVSGGDPLTLSDEALDWLLSRLRRIPHVEFVRIGSKVPAVLPQRVTRNLARTLRKYHPLWVSLHFTHPDELAQDTVRACERLADAGIPLGSQTVLLRGINDRVETLTELYHGLLKARVRPYYLYQCDPIQGSAHFRTPVQTGLDMVRGLRGHTTGYAVPTYVIDAPGGGGKIPLFPETVLGRDAQGLALRNHEQREYHYPDFQPAGHAAGSEVSQ